MLEANRIGHGSEKNPRPVKVSVCDSSFVLQILCKFEDFQNSDKYKLIFISPNHTPEQRVEHRELVKQVKSKREVEKDKRHFIKGVDYTLLITETGQ